MRHKIIIVGSTGKLGSKLLNYTGRNSIPIYASSCYRNKEKLLLQKKRYSISKSFVLSYQNDQSNFLKILEKKIKIIYFLDYGSNSLIYLNYFLKFNSNSIIAIANKEMIIAGGSILQNKIKMTNNIFIPLDSEHFSLINSNIQKNIKKIFITASGGPFYFKKNINFSSVNMKKVLSHPKWDMGTNNLIDSSNFINKILEIYELSHIYSISLSKIDFLISKEAYVHSIIHYEDGSLSLNCFNNDMLITLVKPLRYIYEFKDFKINQNYLNIDNLKIEKPMDNRFLIFNSKKKLMKLSHSNQIKLMIINNSAHKLYLSNKLKYNNIIKYIMVELSKNNLNIKLNSIEKITKFISDMNNYYRTNV
tara:strand:- start:508 stop:1596 length:1089 start_codon:yes stop_codon:yes gene_type:complete